MTLSTVWVIGTGSSGIAAAKALHQRGFEFHCYDNSDHVGGSRERRAAARAAA